MTEPLDLQIFQGSAHALGSTDLAGMTGGPQVFIPRDFKGAGKIPWLAKGLVTAHAKTNHHGMWRIFRQCGGFFSIVGAQMTHANHDDAADDS